MIALQILSSLITASIGCFFIYSGYSKQHNYIKWLQAIEQYDAIYKPIKPVVGSIFPWFEMLVGIALLIPVLNHYAVWAAIAMCIGFIVVLSVNALHGKTRFDCGCYFGGDPSLPHISTVLLRAFILFLLLVAVALWLPAAPISINLMIDVAVVAIAVIGMALVTIKQSTIKQPFTKISS